mgnify:CR=1 FL=1
MVDRLDSVRRSVKFSVCVCEYGVAAVLLLNTYSVRAPKYRRGKKQPGRVLVSVVPCSAVQLALPLLWREWRSAVLCCVGPPPRDEPEII